MCEVEVQKEDEHVCQADRHDKACCLIYYKLWNDYF